MAKSFQEQLEELALDGLRRGVVTPLGFSPFGFVGTVKRRDRYCVLVDQRFFELDGYDLRCQVVEDFFEANGLEYASGGRQRGMWYGKRNYLVWMDDVEKAKLEQEGLVEKIEKIRHNTEG